MRTAIITPYYDEPLEMIAACHASVTQQTRPAKHILVADGHARPELDSWNVEHVRLPESHRDVGGTPRALAALSAFERGYEAVGFLDADNTYEPDHLAEMIALRQSSGAEVCAAKRIFYSLAGEAMAIGQHEDDSLTFIDSNCLFVTGAIRPLLASWTFMRGPLGLCGDYIFSQEILAAGLSVARATRATVRYRTRWAGHYIQAGLPAPEGAVGDVTTEACAWYRSLPDGERQALAGLFRSRLAFFDPLPPEPPADANQPNGEALLAMSEGRIFEVEGRAHFHVPRERFAPDAVFSQLVIAVAAMDDAWLAGTLSHGQQGVSLSDFYCEATLAWTNPAADFKFTLEFPNRRRIKLSWWLIKNSWR